jgi:flavin-binding protein dodecin
MSVYKEIECVGVSKKSWERAAGAAVEHATEVFRDLCLLRRYDGKEPPAPTFTTEVTKLDMTIENGKIHEFRTTVRVSFIHKTESPSTAPPAKLLTFLDRSKRTNT